MNVLNKGLHISGKHGAWPERNNPGKSLHDSTNRQRLTRAFIFGGFFSITTSTERGKGLLRTPAGELNQGSFPSVKHQPSPCQPAPGPSLFPVSYTAHPSLPRLLIPSITAHTTCVLPVILGCKREVKLQVGTGSVSIAREESSEMRPMIRAGSVPVCDSGTK